MIEKSKLSAEVFSRFLDRLMAGISQSIILILDGHPIHKSGIVAEKVRSYKGRLRLYLLPPYSPELNPSEEVWREVKSHRLGRAGVFSFADMKLEVKSAMHHLAHRPDMIRAFFRSKSTIYAA